MYFAFLAFALPVMTLTHLIVAIPIAGILRTELRFLAIIVPYIGVYYGIGFDEDRGRNETALEIVFWLSVLISFVIWFKAVKRGEHERL